MRIETRLDFEVVALEGSDVVHVVIELIAPSSVGDRRRTPATLEVVLDRSGSMAAGRLTAALQALDSLLGCLAAEDRFGLVIFDDDVAVPVPAGPVGDPARPRALLRRIHPGGMTNLAGGLLRGIQEAERIAHGSGATLVLLSDGHANQGVTDHDRLERFAAGARDAGIATSTIGIGLGYDEDLLAAIARGGSGSAHHAADGDEAGAALASEVEGMLDQRVQAASLTVRPVGAVDSVRLHHDLPASPIEGGFLVELGGLHASERRRLLLEVEVPAIAELGLATVCELELRWVDVESWRTELAKVPVAVDVVPGDEAAGRTPDPEVRAEIAFARAQRAKREATDSLQRGDVEAAARRYSDAAEDLRAVELGDAPEAIAADVAAELEALDRLAAEARSDAESAAKRARADYHMKSRKRGRRPR